MKDIYTLMSEGKSEAEIKALFEAEMKCANARKIEEEQAKLKQEKPLHEAREHLVNAFIKYNEYYKWQDEPVSNEDINELLELIEVFEESVMPYVNIAVEAEKRKMKNKKLKKDVKHDLSDEDILNDFLKSLM